MNFTRDLLAAALAAAVGGVSAAALAANDTQSQVSPDSSRKAEPSQTTTQAMPSGTSRPRAGHAGSAESNVGRAGTSDHADYRAGTVGSSQDGSMNGASNLGSGSSATDPSGRAPASNPAHFTGGSNGPTGSRNTALSALPSGTPSTAAGLGNREPAAAGMAERQSSRVETLAPAPQEGTHPGTVRKWAREARQDAQNIQDEMKQPNAHSAAPGPVRKSNGG